MTPESCQLEFFQISASIESKAPPLLFIHGGFHGAWCWEDHFMPWFAERGFDCYAVSLRDHGASARTGRHDEWRLADYVNDAAWAASQIGRKPILIGHSLGGTIVQKLRADGSYPAMILLAPSTIGGSNRAAFRMTATHPGAMIRAAATRDMSLALPAFLSFFLSPNIAEADKARIARRLDGMTSFAAARDAFYTDTPKPSPTAMPVLVVSGEKDWSIPQYKNRKLARAYDGTHKIVPTAHDIMCDTNWEKAAALINGWLSETLAGTGQLAVDMRARA